MYANKFDKTKQTINTNIGVNNFILNFDNLYEDIVKTRNAAIIKLNTPVRLLVRTKQVIGSNDKIYQ